MNFFRLFFILLVSLGALSECLASDCNLPLAQAIPKGETDSFYLKTDKSLIELLEKNLCENGVVNFHLFLRPSEEITNIAKSQLSRPEKIKKIKETSLKVYGPFLTFLDSHSKDGLTYEYAWLNSSLKVQTSARTAIEIILRVEVEKADTLRDLVRPK